MVIALFKVRAIETILTRRFKLRSGFDLFCFVPGQKYRSSAVLASSRNFPYIFLRNVIAEATYKGERRS